MGILKNPRLVSKVCHLRPIRSFGGVLTRSCGQVSKAVAEAVGAHAKAGQLPVTIGGDHSLVCFQSIICTCEINANALFIGYGYYFWHPKVGSEMLYH